MNHYQTLKEAIASQAFVSETETYIHSPDLTHQAWLFDFRKILLQPNILDSYAELFIDTFKGHYPFQVGGLETASIPLIAAIVIKSKARNLPINGFFIRKSRKKTGLLKTVEGTVKNLPVILVDDLINSGGSFQKQVDILSKIKTENTDLDKLTVTGIHALLQFKNPDSYTYFSSRNITVCSFFTLDDFPQLKLKNLSLSEAVLADNSYKILWRWQGGKPALEHIVPKSGLVYTNKRLYFISDEGYVRCLCTTDGTELWHYSVAQTKIRRGQFSTPILYKNTLYFGAHDGNVYALDAHSGQRRWVSFEGDWIGSSPCLNEKDDLLYICVETGLFKKHTTLYALELSNGKVAWSYRLPDAATAAPLLCKKRNNLVVCTQNGKILFFNPTTGDLLAETAITPFEIYAAPVPYLDEKYLIISSLGSDSAASDDSAVFIYSFETKSITKLFTGLSFGNFGGLAIHENLLLITSLDKNIYAVSLPEGKELWKIDTQSRIFSQPYLAKTSEGTRLFVGTNGGQLFEIEPNSGKILSNTYFIERITNPPVYDSDEEVLFVLTYANEIYKIRKLD